MKYHFSIILCFVFCSAYAQKAIVNNIDSLYYLIDTANTSVNNRMWDINSDAIFKRYILLCPCLKNGGRPEFFFSVEGKDDDVYINQNELTAIKLADTSTLIRKAKEIEKNSYKHDYSFFFIEPKNGKYIMHEVNFENPAINIVFLPDMLEKKIDTTTFKIKGAIQADSKNLAKYVNQAVVTTGKIVAAEEIESGKVGLLMVGADYPDQDFTIIIKGDNLSKFYPVSFYKKRWLKVTGKVTLYKGKPAIELSDEKQIQPISPK